jgi:hypothetical protein
VTELSTTALTGNSTADEEELEPDALTTLTVVLVGKHNLFQYRSNIQMRYTAVLPGLDGTGLMTAELETTRRDAIVK